MKNPRASSPSHFVHQKSKPPEQLNKSTATEVHPGWVEQHRRHNHRQHSTNDNLELHTHLLPEQGVVPRPRLRHARTSSRRRRPARRGEQPITIGLVPRSPPAAARRGPGGGGPQKVGQAPIDVAVVVSDSSYRTAHGGRLRRGLAAVGFPRGGAEGG